MLFKNKEADRVAFPSNPSTPEAETARLLPVCG